LQSATSHEERQEILRTIGGLDDSIQLLQEELYDHGCYVSPPVITRLVGINFLELTQSTQYNSIDGTGAGGDNTVWLIESKPLLVRAYLQSDLTEPNTVSGDLEVWGYNNNTLTFDILRRRIAPMNLVPMQPSSTSRRSDLAATLNFLVPADLCWGNASFNVHAWFSGHESEASGTSPSYKAQASRSNWFNRRRTPIIHCFRITLSQTVPDTTTPLQFAAPSFADCQTTMAHAERMFPVADLDIRDSGTRAFSGPLQNDDDYDAVRADIQTVVDGTTPTPARNELYVALLPRHQFGANVFASQLAQSLGSTVSFDQLFSHELGHWLLPGDDHVSDAACINPALALTQIDTNYPDYPNAMQRAGIGEWGVDLGPVPPRLHRPETPEVMSYCRGTQWISPYNYVRAFNGAVLSWAPDADTDAARAEGQKLLLAFRLKRDETVELRWALHLPGEPPPQSPDGMTEVVLELYDAEGAMLASARCHRPADRATAGPHEDFQEVLPWFEEVAYVVVVRDGNELARWPTEAVESASPISELNVTEARRSDGASTIQVTWDEPEDATQRHYMLRYTPDEGQTWIPLVNGIEQPRVDVDPELLRGIERARFQLAASAGFRTTLVESRDAVSGPPLEREVTISQPQAGAQIEQGDPIWLAGAATTGPCGSAGSATAYWTSNRDGFLADGLRAVVSELSVGRHVLRLVVEDGSGGELSKTVVICVAERGYAPQAEQGA
jgi:hypothetical protein